VSRFTFSSLFEGCRRLIDLTVASVVVLGKGGEEGFLVFLCRLEVFVLLEYILGRIMCGNGVIEEAAISNIGDGGISGSIILSGFIEGLANINFRFGWIEMLLVGSIFPGVSGLVIGISRPIAVDAVDERIAVHLVVVHAGILYNKWKNE
jgi:hypothetical protein